MTATSTEAFTCDLYPVTRRSTSTTDELRHLMFCQRRTNNEMLPPTSDCLKLHLNRPCHVLHSRRSSLDGMQDLGSPEEHGWELEDGCLRPEYMTKEPAPRSLVELTTCKCQKSYSQGNCSCSNTGLSCSKACSCMADKSCCNPHNAAVQLLSDSQNDSEDDLEDSDAD